MSDSYEGRGGSGGGRGGMGSSSGPEHAISTGLPNYVKKKNIFFIQEMHQVIASILSINLSNLALKKLH